MSTDSNFEPVGFWARTGAALIDTVLILCLTSPLLWWIYGPDYFDTSLTDFIAGPADLLLSYVFPAVATVAFWTARSATPGKLVIGARVVDALTGAPISFKQSVVRYLGYYVATLPLGLGLLWVAFDERKQGWHDKIAGTLVVRAPRAHVSDARASHRPSA